MSNRDAAGIVRTAPDFTLKDGDGNDWRLADHRGKSVVLLFYPGDETPVCTKQMCSVRDRWEDYQALGAEVVGISTDTPESHQKFAAHHSLPLRLLSDRDGAVAAMFGAKSWLPGRAARAVIVIDAEGRVRHNKAQALSLFRPKDDEVLDAIRAAQADEARG
jgi:thioredoxin-dependent peroxiredoxin